MTSPCPRPAHTLVWGTVTPRHRALTPRSQGSQVNSSSCESSVGEKERQRLLEREGVLPQLLGNLERERVRQFGHTQGAGHLAAGETLFDAAQAEHVVTGQDDRLLCVSQADGARPDPEPGAQGQRQRRGRELAGGRWKQQRLRPLSPGGPTLEVSPGEGQTGLLLTVTESGHHRPERPDGLDVRVLLQTLEEKGRDREEN